MRAFVFSGGGNRGPMQVGAVKALLEQGIRPDMVIGCSAGALNAAYLSRGFTAEMVKELAQVWRDTTLNDIYPGSRVGTLWRIISRKDSFYDNRNFYDFLQRTGTTPAQTFGTAPAYDLYITATDLESGALHVFGDDPGDHILDALMASTALPPMHPPWEVNGRRYIDGGTITPLPLRVALERGATEIYALHVADPAQRDSSLVKGVLSVMGRSVSTMLRLQADHDLFLIEKTGKVKFHYIALSMPNSPGDLDFTQADRMIASGYETMRSHLESAPGSRPHIALEPRSVLSQLGNRARRLWARTVPAAPTVDEQTSGLGGADHPPTQVSA